MTGRTGYTSTPAAFDPQVHMDAIYGHFDALIGETRANAAALPASGNWVGREIVTEDTMSKYRWGGSSWEVQSEDSGWVYPTLTNGTVTAGNTFGYRRVVTAGVKIVYLRGRVTGVSSGQTMVTLPAGFRPDSGVDNVLILDQSTQRVNFGADGTIVALSTWGANSASFLGVNFIAA